MKNSPKPSSSMTLLAAPSASSQVVPGLMVSKAALFALRTVSQIRRYRAVASPKTTVRVRSEK